MGNTSQCGNCSLYEDRKDELLVGDADPANVGNPRPPEQRVQSETAPPGGIEPAAAATRKTNPQANAAVSAAPAVEHRTKKNCRRAPTEGSSESAVPGAVSGGGAINGRGGSIQHETPPEKMRPVAIDREPTPMGGPGRKNNAGPVLSSQLPQPRDGSKKRGKVAEVAADAATRFAASTTAPAEAAAGVLGGTSPPARKDTASAARLATAIAPVVDTTTAAPAVARDAASIDTSVAARASAAADVPADVLRVEPEEEVATSAASIDAAVAAQATVAADVPAGGARVAPEDEVATSATVDGSTAQPVVALGARTIDTSAAARATSAADVPAGGRRVEPEDEVATSATVDGSTAQPAVALGSAPADTSAAARATAAADAAERRMKSEEEVAKAAILAATVTVATEPSADTTRSPANKVDDDAGAANRAPPDWGRLPSVGTWATPLRPLGRGPWT